MAHMQLLSASLEPWACVPYLVATPAPSANKDGGASPHSVLRRAAALPGSPEGSSWFSMNRTMLNWHNAVTCLVFAFRISSFPSPEYVKHSSLYITNHCLNFKALGKNDLTLHLRMSLSSHFSVVPMGTNGHQRRKREEETVRTSFQWSPLLPFFENPTEPMSSADGMRLCVLLSMWMQLSLLKI